MKGLLAIGLMLAGSLIGTVSANAHGYCTETVKSAILSGGVTVYFTTDKSCPSWCKLDWSEGDARNRGWSMLMTAKTMDVEIKFGWNEHASSANCGEALAVYTSPAQMMFVD